MNIRLFHLKQIGKRKKEELQNKQGRNGNVAEGNRTGDEGPGQTQAGDCIQENFEENRIIENERKGERMELMTLKQIGAAIGKSYWLLNDYARNHKIKPVKRENQPGVGGPAGMYDPAPFFEKFGKAESTNEKLPYEKPTIEPATHEESQEALNQFYEETAAEEYPSIAPPLPGLTPELILAFKEVMGTQGAMNVLRYNYGLNWIGEE